MLRHHLSLLFSNYEVPEGMLHHGLTLLGRVIDLDQSNSDTLVLVDDSLAHIIQENHNCLDMVYLLVKNLLPSTIEQQSPFAIEPHTRVYGGQTVNFNQREARRNNHVMGRSDVKICLGHGMTSLQVDCLEVTLIGFLLLSYGMRTTNNTIYPKYIYRHIPQTLSIDNETDHPNPLEHGTNTWGMVQRAMVIGTAPPQREFHKATYQINLREWQERTQTHQPTWNPLLNWGQASMSSQNIRALRNLLQSQSGDLPPFINHYPKSLSRNYRELFQALNMSDIVEADKDVQSSIKNLNKDVIILLGARPTFLYSASQSRHYFAEVCPYVDLHWLSTNICGFVLWWPDLGLRAHTNTACNQLLEQIWLLTAQKLHLLLWKLEQVSPKTIGVPEQEAISIVNWLKEHPTSIQIESLMKELSRIWTSQHSPAPNETASYSSVIDFQVIRDYDMTPVETLPEDAQPVALPLRIIKQLPTMSLSQVMSGWSATRQVAILRNAVKMIPNFHALEELEKAQKLQILVQMQMDSLMRSWLNNYKRHGLFIPFEGETEREQWARFWKQINLQRMLRGNHRYSTCWTCCWCGQRAMRVAQENNRVNFSTVQDGCPNGRAHATGWEVVAGDHESIFPESNIFLLFFESLPSALVVNHWQLCVAFSNFLESNQWHLQAKVLYDRYHEIFPMIRGFRSSENTKGTVSVFIRGLTNAMEKLKQLQPPCNIMTSVRVSIQEEREWSKGFAKDKNLFGIRLVYEASDVLVLSRLEDFTFMDYGQALGIIRKPNPYYIVK